MIYDRLHVLTSTSGTAAYLVTGPASNRLSIDEALDAAGVTKAGAKLLLWVLPDDSAGSDDFEYGIYTYDGTNTLTRTTIIRSSNSNAAVSWGATQRNIVSAPDASLLRRLLDVVICGTAGGTANAVTLSPNMPIGALQDNLIVEWTAAYNNTTDATLVPSTGITAKPLRRPGAPATALAAGAVKLGQRYRSRYSAADDVWYNAAAEPVLAESTDIVAGTGGNIFVNPEQLRSFLPTGAFTGYWGTAAPAGWVFMNGRTIGSAASGATERANADCEALFKHLWNDTGLTVSSGRGASAAADWTANKTITLPDTGGRVIAGLDAAGGSTAKNRLTSGGAGITSTTLGASGGTETHTLTTAQLAAHVHADGRADLGVSSGAGGGAAVSGTSTGSISTTQSAGSGAAHQNTQPTIVAPFIMKL